MDISVRTQNLFIFISLVKLIHSHRKYSRKNFFRWRFLKCNVTLVSKSLLCPTLHHPNTFNRSPYRNAKLYRLSNYGRYSPPPPPSFVPMLIDTFHPFLTSYRNPTAVRSTRVRLGRSLDHVHHWSLVSGIGVGSLESRYKIPRGDRQGWICGVLADL